MIKVKLKTQLDKGRSNIIRHNRIAIDSLIDTVGGVGILAFMLNIGYTTVKSWSDRGRISKKGAELVATHDELKEFYTAEELRLDLKVIRPDNQ